MAKKNKIDKKYYLLDSEANNNDTSTATTNTIPDDFAVSLHV